MAFLVPGARVRRATAFADGDLAASVALVAGEIVEPRAAARCDLAVAADPGAAQLRGAFEALAPGGALYAEWPRPVLGGERAIHRRLGQAGFTDTRCLFAWPPPARATPAFWLPLDSPEAVRHLLATRPRDPGLRGTLTACVRAGSWRLARALGLLPLTATARRPGAEPGDDSGLAATLSRTPAVGAPQAQQRDCRLLLLTGGDSVLNKVVALPFVPGDGAPRAAVKLARVSRSQRALENERLILDHLAPAAVPGVPRVLAAGTWGDSPFVAESVVAGRPLWSHIASGDDLAPVLERATSLLIAVAQATVEPETAPFGGWRERLALEAHLSLSQHPRSGAVLYAAQELLAPLDRIPATMLHGDCTPWNVTVDRDGTVGLLDWESSIVNGLPLFDLTYLLGYTAIFADRVADTPDEPESYRRLLDPATPLGGLRVRLEARYATAMGIPQAALRPLRIATWIFQHRPDLAAVELSAR